MFKNGRIKVFTKTVMLLLTVMVTFASVTLFSVTNAAVSEYESKEDAIIAGAELNLQIALEGMVLLKNENNALPLETGVGTDASKISLFGYKSVYPDGGGSEGGDTSGGIVRLTSDIYTSLKDAGYMLNPVIKSVYQTWRNESNDNRSDYWFAEDDNYASMLSEMQVSYSEYDDAAIIVLSATGLEPVSFGGITPALDSTTMLDPDDNVIAGLHKRQFDAGQLALVDEVTANFDNVIVVINSSIPVEMAPIQNNPAVDAIVLSGEPGENGFIALGLLLSGKANFSGKLADTYMADYTMDPTFNNWARNGVSAGTDGATVSGNQYTDESGDPRNSWFVDYEEGIYVGYRYYESRGYDQFMQDGDYSWYDSAVVYPFGYGLSYTDFTWEVLNTSTPAGVITSDDTVTVKVKVTNDGEVSGKDVVQLYYTAPYTNGGIEKSHVVLGEFAKTRTLQPGESQVLTLEIDARDMASYDYNDANGDLFTGYELESGDYVVKVMSNSHDVFDSITYSVAAPEHLGTSEATGNPVVNQFDYVNDVVAVEQTDLLTREEVGGVLGLSNPTTTPTSGEQILTDAEHANWFATVDDTGQPWEVLPENAPADPADPATRPEVPAIMFEDMVGASFDDPRWETLIDQLSINEMTDLINNAGFKTIALPYIGKPATLDTDGPKGWTGNGTQGAKGVSFASEVVIASTWNKELAYQMGQMIGEQGLWGNSDRDSGVNTYNGWYAPAMNTHRSIFDWRYTEYYSEDGYLAGMMAANASLGAKSKGAYVYIKHFALHEDGATDRGMIFSGPEAGLSVWANEQTMREVYFKPFQIAVEQGSATAVMSSFSRIGYKWAGANYELLTAVLRDEWGFEGTVITDIAIYGYMNTDLMIRVGGDALLGIGRYTISTDITDNPTKLAAIRRAVKNILFTTVNSNVLDVPMGAKVNYEGGELDAATIDAAYTASVQDAVLNTDWAFSEISYELTGGMLPDGLTFDSETGEISGTPTMIDDYEFTFTASADGYESASATFMLSVNDVLTFDEKLAALETQISDDLAAAIAVLEAMDTQISTDLAAAITTLEASITTVNDSVVANATDITDLAAVVTTLEASITAVNDAVIANDGDITDLADDIVAVNAAVTALQTALESADSDLSDEIDALNDLLVVLNTGLSTESDRVDAIESTLAETGCGSEINLQTSIIYASMFVLLAFVGFVLIKKKRIN